MNSPETSGKMIVNRKCLREAGILYRHGSLMKRFEIDGLLRWLGLNASAVSIVNKPLSGLDKP
jgi:hypothetical protein